MERPCFDSNEIELTEEQMIKISQLAQSLIYSFDKHIRLRNNICSSWIIEYVNKIIREIEKGETNGKS